MSICRMPVSRHTNSEIKIHSPQFLGSAIFRYWEDDEHRAAAYPRLRVIDLQVVGREDLRGAVIFL